MLEISNLWVDGWEHTIRGMRNPMNSWDKSDSGFGCRNKIGMGDDSEVPYLCKNCGMIHCNKRGEDFLIGPNDIELMHKLCKAGSDHRKFMRQIFVSMDIVAPLYWWKEFSTYKIGTVANSCSTMHKIHAKEFTLEDFSCEHLIKESIGELQNIIDKLNYFRDKFISWKESDFFIDNNQQLVDRKVIWWQMIQLLPSSYNQKRTVTLNYEVLNNMYNSRKNHKLDEWHTFLKIVDELPMSELITGEF